MQFAISPDQVEYFAKHNAQIRLSWLSIFAYNSNFSTSNKCIGSQNEALRGVPLRNNIYEDAFKIVLENPEYLDDTKIQELRNLLKEKIKK